MNWRKKWSEKSPARVTIQLRKVDFGATTMWGLFRRITTINPNKDMVWSVLPSPCTKKRVENASEVKTVQWKRPSVKKSYHLIGQNSVDPVLVQAQQPV